jgi:hypothetical protein
MATACKLTAVTGRDQRLMLGAAVAMSALLLAAGLVGHPELLAYAAPVFLLAVPLLAGRYVGEDRLERLRERRARPSRLRPTAVALPAKRRVVALLPRGGRLIATALAVRPPPSLSVS